MNKKNIIKNLTIITPFKDKNNSRLENKYHSKQGKLNVSDSDYVDQLTYDFINSVAFTAASPILFLSVDVMNEEGVSSVIF